MEPLSLADSWREWGRGCSCGCSTSNEKWATPIDRPLPVLYAFDATNTKLLSKSPTGQLAAAGQYNERTVLDRACRHRPASDARLMAPYGEVKSCAHRSHQ